MGLTLKRTSAPAAEPLTRAEAKAHLRIIDTAEDTLVDSLIKAAREVAESVTRRAFIDQTWRLSMDKFPGSDGVIELPRNPVSSITTFAYTDTDSVAQTLVDGTDYQKDLDTEPARLAPFPSTSWPDTESETLNAVRITFVAGYGADETTTPEEIRHAMRLLIGTWYAFREDIISGTIVSSLPKNVAAMNLLSLMKTELLVV